MRVLEAPGAVGAAVDLCPAEAGHAGTTRATARAGSGPSRSRSSGRSRIGAFDAWSADRRALEERDAGLALIPQIARAAQALCEARAWDALGFPRIGAYCHERLRRSSRWLQDHAALGAAIARLPVLQKALLGEDGPPIGRVVATAIGRIATPDTIAAWIDRARASRARAILLEIRAMRERAAPIEGEFAETSATSKSRCTLEEPEPEIADTTDVRLQLPRAVAAAFEEVLDLHRVVSGGEVSVASFIEALIAESGGAIAALPEAPASDDDFAPVEAMSHPASEQAEQQTTAASAPKTTLEEDTKLTPRQLERQLLSLLRLESARERRLGRILYDMDQHNVWTALGFTSAGEYAVERLGMGRRTAETRIGIVRALRKLPVVGRAYESGQIGIEAAWILTHMLRPHRPAPEVQRTWVTYARAKSIKRLRDDLRRLRLLDLVGPDGSNGPDGLDGEPESLARGGCAGADRTGHCACAPQPPTNQEWYASLYRSPGRSRERLRSLRLARASADVCVRLRLPTAIARAFLSAIETARRRAEAIAAAIPWTEPWAAETPASLRAARAYAEQMQPAPAWVGVLALLEEYVDTWDDPRTFPRREWDEVYARAGWRCEAPGCTARVRMEDHHIVYRSQGGGDELWNQLCLCSAHHRQGEHGDLAQCRGRAPLDVTWRLGKKEYASWYRNETRLDRD